MSEDEVPPNSGCIAGKKLGSRGLRLTGSHREEQARWRLK
jgi:hypothetical protein